MAAATADQPGAGDGARDGLCPFMAAARLRSAFVLLMPNLFPGFWARAADRPIPILNRRSQRGGNRNVAGCQRGHLRLTAAAAVVTVVRCIGISLGGRRAVHGETRLMSGCCADVSLYAAGVPGAVFIGMANARGHSCARAGGGGPQPCDDCQRAPPGPADGAHPGGTNLALAIGVLVPGWPKRSSNCRACPAKATATNGFRPGGTPRSAKSYQKMLPGSIGVAAFQINVLVTSWFSFWFGKSIVADFNYSVRLMELPQGMFGTLPGHLSAPHPRRPGRGQEAARVPSDPQPGAELSRLREPDRLRHRLTLAVPIVRLLFERGKIRPRRHAASRPIAGISLTSTSV